MEADGRRQLAGLSLVADKQNVPAGTQWKSTHPRCVSRLFRCPALMAWELGCEKMSAFEDVGHLRNSCLAGTSSRRDMLGGGGPAIPVACQKLPLTSIPAVTIFFSMCRCNICTRSLRKSAARAFGQA